jgi:hypothetical protein
LKKLGVGLKARQLIGLVLTAVGIALIPIGVFLVSYHYTRFFISGPLPIPILLPGSPDVYPYSLAGIVLFTLGSILLVDGVLLLLISLRNNWLLHKQTL